MLWVWLFVGIALAGLAVLICFAVWLWRKTTGLLEEVGGVLDRTGEVMDLLSQVRFPEPGPDPDPHQVPATYDRSGHPRT